MLAGPQIEKDRKRFLKEEPHTRRKWKNEKLIQRDLVRTQFLSDNQKMHSEIKRVVEFYCSELAITYCQGMLEVVLPFLYMKPAAGSEEGLALSYALFKRFVGMFLTNILHPRFNG